MKRVVASLAALAFAALPVGAASNAERQEHLELYHALEDTNIRVYANEPEMCDPEEGYLGFYSPRHRLISICQKDPTVNFTDEDLDTLRHEAHHVVQDCLDGQIDGRMTLLFTGEAKERFLRNYPDSKELRVQRIYRDAGESEHIVALEVEAFAVAATVPADTIANAIRETCKGQ